MNFDQQAISENLEAQAAIYRRLANQLEKLPEALKPFAGKVINKRLFDAIGDCTVCAEAREDGYKRRIETFWARWNPYNSTRNEFHVHVGYEGPERYRTVKDSNRTGGTYQTPRNISTETTLYIKVGPDGRLGIDEAIAKITERAESLRESAAALDKERKDLPKIIEETCRLAKLVEDHNRTLSYTLKELRVTAH